jgi:thiamine-phosphate pyrophosphorylase
MPNRQPLPNTWLMTDERLGDRLIDAIGRLPDGAGIVFRHYQLDESARRRLFDRVQAAAARARLLLLLAGPAAQAKVWGADGSHGRGPGPGLRSAPAHDLKEIRAAEAAGASFIFLSPVFPTRSHPDTPALGPVRFGLIVRNAKVPIIALGGMDGRRAASLRALGAYGWAGIDAWADEKS